MSKTARRLGRGLDSLVSDLRDERVGSEPPAVGSGRLVTASQPPARSPGAASQADHGGPLTVPVTAISPNPYQPRSSITDQSIETLSDSIRLHGVLQPITVRRRGERFEIVAGERRWQAAKRCGLADVPVVVREADDQQMLELALIENLQREDLNAIERAKAYRQFCDRFGMRAEEVAGRVGEDRSTVANYMRLLELSEGIQGMVAAGKLSMGHARCLLSTSDRAERERLAAEVVRRDMSVRMLEEVMRLGREGREATLAGKPPVAQERLRSAHLREMEQRFERALKTKVTIREGKKKGTGRVIVEFFTLDDFDRIAGAVGVTLE